MATHLATVSNIYTNIKTQILHCGVKEAVISEKKLFSEFKMQLLFHLYRAIEIILKIPGVTVNSNSHLMTQRFKI